MRTTLAMAFAMLLSACATAPSAPAPDVTSISVDISSWGYLQERWTISSNGEATFESKQRGDRLDTAPRSQTFTFTPADFERVRSALAPNERFIDSGLACDVAMTDAPYGKVRWRRADGTEQEVSYYTACRDSRDLSFFFEHLNAADQIVHDLAGAPGHF